MSRVIRISEGVFRRLQTEARALGFTLASPDNVLRFMLGIEQAGKKRVGSPSCPKCGAAMAIGTAHDDGDQYQWECACGYIKGVSMISE